MIGTALAIAFVVLGLVLLVVALTGRETLPEFECGECGRSGTGPRCHVVDHDEDPLTGEGFAMVADFHPEHCPVIDPAHVHAR